MITGPSGPTFEQLAAEEAKKPVITVPAPAKEPKRAPDPAPKKVESKAPAAKAKDK